MSRQRYNQACRTMVVVSALGMIMAMLFAWAAIIERDWQYMPFIIGGWLVNYAVFVIVVADGARRFGDRES